MQLNVCEKTYTNLGINHKNISNIIYNNKLNLDDIKNELWKIDNDLLTYKNDYVKECINTKLSLLDKKITLRHKYDLYINEEMDYYDIIGDLIIEYYVKKTNTTCQSIEKKNINDILYISKDVSKNKLLEKFYNRLIGIRITKEDGKNRIKYCTDCNIEKILDVPDSAFVCPLCGHSENIILDDDRKIKEYSPYKRLNHFKKWLNQFQGKQTPNIPNIVFTNIINELKKTRITDLTILNENILKAVLKKLKYNIYYKHIIFIIHRLNNIPSPTITKDMETIFICMFYKIQKPWDLFKPYYRKNFLSYSYVFHKFCDLLDLNHLLECFKLHKDSDKVIENDKIWKQICNHLGWVYKSSFK